MIKQIDTEIVAIVPGVFHADKMVFSDIGLYGFEKCLEAFEIIGEFERIDNDFSGRSHDVGPMIALANIDTDEIVLHKYISFL